MRIKISIFLDIKDKEITRKMEWDKYDLIREYVPKHLQRVILKDFKETSKNELEWYK